MTSFRIIRHPSGKALLYRNSSVLTLHVTIDQDDSFEEWKDSAEEPRDSFEGSKHSSEEWKDSIEG